MVGKPAASEQLTTMIAWLAWARASDVQTWARDSVSAFSANKSARAEASLKNPRRADELLSESSFCLSQRMNRQWQSPFFSGLGNYFCYSLFTFVQSVRDALKCGEELRMLRFFGL